MVKQHKGTIVCRCEEATDEEIFRAIKLGAKNLDDVKRMTRAGMGLCQGKTCRELISRILSNSLGKKLEEINNGSYRCPVRPLHVNKIREKYIKTKGGDDK